MIESKIPINLIRGTVYFKEFSFYEYKNICKMLISDDIYDIDKCFETILARIEASFSLNIIEKFECLVNIRNSILGKELILNLDERRVTFDLSSQLLNLIEEAEFTSSIQHAAADYLYSYKGRDISNATLDEKLQILNTLDLSIIKLASEVERIREQNKISILNDIVDINIYDTNILYFLKNIITSDLMDLYSFEYQILRHLNLKGNDLQYYTYPELKIKINMLMKEKEEKQNSSNSRSIE